MKGTRFLSLGLVCLASAHLGAQTSGLSTRFKLRGGLQAASKKDGLDNRLLGFGVELAIPVAKGSFGIEVGYLHKDGTQYRLDVSTMDRASGAIIDAANSTDSRQNRVDGLNLRLAYEAPFVGDWSWRAGLQFGGSKFRHQYIGKTTDSSTYTDTYYGTPTKNSSTPSVFGGFSYRFDDSSSVELGVLLHSYSALEYQHVAGTVRSNAAPYTHTTQDRLTTTSRMVPHIECAYVFRF